MPVQTSQAVSLEVLEEDVNDPDSPSIAEDADRPPPLAQVWGEI
jgi:hypothetical protein